MNSKKFADIRWGIGEGILLTGIVLVPATLVFITKRNENSSEDVSRFIKIVMWYLAYGVICGALAGNWRRQLATRKGAVLFGTLVGAVTFATFVLLSKTVRDLAPSKTLLAVAIGTLVGAIFGGTAVWWGWAEFRRHSQKG
jgi:hypothetical protein